MKISRAFKDEPSYAGDFINCIPNLFGLMLGYILLFRNAYIAFEPTIPVGNLNRFYATCNFWSAPYMLNIKHLLPIQKSSVYCRNKGGLLTTK
jgi:hypothetical protein